MEPSPVGHFPPGPGRRRERLAGLLGLAVIGLFLAGGAALRQAVQGRVQREKERCLSLLLRALDRQGGADAGAAAAFGEASGCYSDLLRAKPFSAEFAFRAQACEDLGGYLAAGPAGTKNALEEAPPEFRGAFDDLAAGRFGQAAGRFAALGRGEGPGAEGAARYGDLSADLDRALRAPGAPGK